MLKILLFRWKFQSFCKHGFYILLCLTLKSFLDWGHFHFLSLCRLLFIFIKPAFVRFISKFHPVSANALQSRICTSIIDHSSPPTTKSKPNISQPYTFHCPHTPTYVSETYTWLLCTLFETLQTALSKILLTRSMQATTNIFFLPFVNEHSFSHIDFPPYLPSSLPSLHIIGKIFEFSSSATALVVLSPILDSWMYWHDSCL